MNLQQQIALSKSELVSTIVVFLLIVLLVLSSRLTRLTSDTSIVFTEQTELILEDRTDLDQLIVKLNSAEIEVDRDEIKWASRLLGWRNFLRGRYIFEGGYTYNSFFSKMARGIQDPVNFVILPGTTMERISETAGQKLHFSKQDLLNQLTDSSFLADNDFSKEDLLGRMLPETYLVYWTSSPKELVNKVLRQFENSVTTDFEDRAAELGYSMDEIITLASIVEWEAKFDEEKSTISGLYWNRLDQSMRLQADPTVNYALGERRRLLFEDYQIDHPFNTYQRNGLPPGPITNPSISTIEATLYPEQHDYLYMVANPEGGHVFTETFREHQAESEKWRIWLREQYRIKREREAEQQRQEQETR